MSTDGNEAKWLTRKKRIDTKLRSVNPPWQIIPWRDDLDTSKLARHAVTAFHTAMLWTAMAVPALEFIVFLRPVKSRILWEQMLGRGTRLCPDINKSKFVVFDCFDGTLIQYFRNVSSFDIEPPGRTPLTLPEVIENIWQNVDHDYHVRILAKRLLRIDKNMNAVVPNAKGRAGFVMVNVPQNRHSCSLKITEDVRKNAAKQAIAEEEAWKNGVEEKSKEFVESGAEMYTKA